MSDINKLMTMTCQIYMYIPVAAAAANDDLMPPRHVACCMSLLELHYILSHYRR